MSSTGNPRTPRQSASITSSCTRLSSASPKNPSISPRSIQRMVPPPRKTPRRLHPLPRPERSRGTWVEGCSAAPLPVPRLRSGGGRGNLDRVLQLAQGGGDGEAGGADGGEDAADQAHRQGEEGAFD